MPLIQKFEAGYVQGAKAVAPNIEVDVEYISPAGDFSGFNDPAQGTEVARGQLDGGADVVYHAAGASGQGVFEAVKRRHAGRAKLAIGVDSDQYNSRRAADVNDVIMTSMLKRVDVAVFDYINAVAAGRHEHAAGGVRPEGRRRRLRHLRRQDRRHHRPTWTPTRPRSSAARSRSQTTPSSLTGQRHRRGAGSARDPAPGRSSEGWRRWPIAELAPTAAEYAVELTGITKRFPGVVANSDIHLRVRRGEVHALCGENGAGKSTLMKILYGMQQPGRGHHLGGRRGGALPLAGRRDQGRDRHGAPALHAGRQPHRRRERPARRGGSCTASAPRPRQRIAELAEHGRAARPARTCSSSGSGVADRQRVEILKVLYRGARTVILDEPTAVLVPQEVDELFATLRRMRAEGFTFLFISHKLDEVRAIADTITVIRRGHLRRHAPTRRTVTTRQLAEMMVGSELPSPETRESTVTDREVLRVDRPRRSPARAAAGRCSTASTWWCAPARCSASPASRATGRPSSSRRSWGCAGRAAARSCWTARDITRAQHAAAPGGRHRLRARGPHPARPARHPAAVGQPDPRLPEPPAGRPRAGCSACSTGPRRGATPSASSRSSTCARPASTCPRPRCPAATSRSWWSAASCPATRCC